MRIGAVPYLNGKPLVHGLDGEPDVELLCDVPSRLAQMLENEEIAAGLVSLVACFFNPALRILPGITISCIGPAESVKLFYKDSPSSVTRVALDTSSLTSVLLARLILRERYGVEPEFVSMPPSLPDMLDACDSGVLIGDPAMRASATFDWPTLDLGEEWYLLTGLPFVFAVWAVNPDLATPDLAEVLGKAKVRGVQSLEEISASEAMRLSLPVEVCFRYLSKIMNYDMTDRHMEAMNLFHEKARNYGLAPGGVDLKLLEH